MKSRKVFNRNFGGANHEGLTPKNINFVIFLKLFAAQEVQTDSDGVVLVYYILLTIAIHYKFGQQLRITEGNSLLFLGISLALHQENVSREDSEVSAQSKYPADLPFLSFGREMPVRFVLKQQATIHLYNSFFEAHLSSLIVGLMRNNAKKRKGITMSKLFSVVRLFTVHPSR